MLLSTKLLEQFKPECIILNTWRISNRVSLYENVYVETALLKIE